MPHTDLEIRRAKRAEKPYKLLGEKALYLLVSTSGKKLRRLKHRFLGKEKLLALGQYPEVTLAEPRRRSRCRAEDHSQRRGSKRHSRARAT